MSNAIAKRNKKGQFQKGSKHLVTHGMYGTHFHTCFRGMIQRCTDPNHKSYKDYGGREIKVEWKSFEEFKADMYDSYLAHFKLHEGDTTIERIDNEKNYSKENCKWATRTEQLKHKRSIRYLTHEGITLSMADWSRKLGIDIRYISRDTKNGKTLEQIIGLAKAREALKK